MIADPLWSCVMLPCGPLLYLVIPSPHHITEETDAGLDRPLYLRNNLYDKTLKSQNYYSNVLWTA